MALVARWPVRRSAVLVLSYYPGRVRITSLRVLSCSLILNGFAVGLSGLRAWVAAGLGVGGWFGVWRVGCVVGVGPVGFDWRYCLVCGAVAVHCVCWDRTR